MSYNSDHAAVAIWEAALVGDCDTLRRLLKEGGRLPQDTTQHALRIAAANDHTEVLACLLAYDADLVHFCDTSPGSRNAMETAAYCGAFGAAAVLLGHGASMGEALSDAVLAGRPCMVEFLLLARADVNDAYKERQPFRFATADHHTVGYRDYTHLMQAIWHPGAKAYGPAACLAMVQTLLDGKADPNRMDSRVYLCGVVATPLGAAAYMGLSDVAQVLLEAHALPTALALKCGAHKSFDIVQALLNAKADARNIIVRPPVHNFETLRLLLEAKADFGDAEDRDALVVYIAEHHSSRGVRLLLQHGIRPSTGGIKDVLHLAAGRPHHARKSLRAVMRAVTGTSLWQQCTPVMLNNALMVAAREVNTDAAVALVHAKADPQNPTRKWREHVLTRACMSNRTDFVAALLKLKASPFNPGLMHTCVSHGSADAAALLLGAKASIQVLHNVDGSAAFVARHAALAACATAAASTDTPASSTHVPT